MRKMNTFIGGVLVLLSFQLAMGRTSDEGTAYRMYHKDMMDINNVETWITNWGDYGQNPARTAGCYFPKGSGEPYIYGAGVWIGGFDEKEYTHPDTIKDHTFLFPGGHLPDTLIGVPLVSVGYNTVGSGYDFCPGPVDSAHMWDHWLDKQSHPEDRLYFSTREEDMEEWPLRDSLGKPISAVFGVTDRWADQEVWCEFHDMMDSIHHEGAPFPTYHLGLYVRQTAFAWNAKVNKNIFFLLREFKNVADDTIRYMYVGHASDMDIGDADNDLLGIDVRRSLGWTCTLTQEIGWSSSPPYYVGVKFLQGPKADYTIGLYGEDGMGNPVIDTVVYAGERLPLTAFNKCTRQVDADDERKRYMMLAGYDITTGEYNPFGSVPDMAPQDKRMIMGCGPFELAPGEVDTFLTAVMFSNGDYGGLDFLKAQGDVAQLMFENNWAFPSPPPAPKVTVTPGDGKIVIVWDNSPENFADPFYPIMISPAAGDPVADTLYRECDFEGYRLWKSRTGVEGDWQLMGQWDIENAITLLPGDVYVPGLGNASGEESNNLGLVYSYVDEDVINGVPYYYAVTAYDYNTPGDHVNKNQDVWVSLESGFFAKTVTPRAEPCDIMPMETDVSLSRGHTNVASVTGSVIETPMAVTGDTYKLVWGETFHTDADPVFSYRIYNETKGEWVTATPSPVRTPTEARSYTNPEGESVEEWYGTFTTPVFDGIRLTGEIIVDLTPKADTLGNNISAVRLPDSIKVTTGNYPEDALGIAGWFVPSGTETGFGISPENKKWAFKGGVDIEVRWIMEGDTLTCEVWDVRNGAQIPANTLTDDGWCFSGKMPIKAPKAYLTANDRAIWFYICGVRYNFNQGSGMTADQFAQIANGDVWRIYSSCDAVMPCRGNEFTIETNAMQYGKTEQLDMVRVVPNPYVVRAAWDLSRDYQWVHFTHLPSECTIRIYTLSGDLVRKIEHSATSEDGIFGDVGGMEAWDLMSSNNQLIASGIYLYHISTPDGEEKVGKFAIVR